MSVCQMLCSHFGLVIAGSVMDFEVRPLKAAIQRLQGKVLAGFHPAATRCPPEILKQLWDIYYSAKQFNRQIPLFNELPGAPLDAGEYCLSVKRMPPPCGSSIPYFAGSIRAELQQQRHPLHHDEPPVWYDVTSTDG